MANKAAVLVLLIASGAVMNVAVVWAIATWASRAQTFGSSHISNADLAKWWKQSAPVGFRKDDDPSLSSFT